MTQKAPDINLTIEPKGFGDARRKLESLKRRLPGAISQAIGYEATVLAGDIRRGIRNQAPGGRRFRPLAESTKKRKGSSKALIDHGDLLRSIKAEQFQRDKLESAYFVGVNKHVKTRDGKEMWNIAEIHEKGSKKFTIRITPKLRRFWFAMFKAGVFSAPLKRRRTIIEHPGVPARPFLQPSFDKWKTGAEKRIIDRVKKRLGIK